MTNDEINKEISKKMEEIAELSVEILKNDGVVAAIVEIGIINVLGKCMLDLKVSSTPKGQVEWTEDGVPDLTNLANQVIRIQEQEEVKQTPAEQVDEMLRNLRGNAGQN